MDLVEQAHWNRLYEDIEPALANEDDTIRRWIEKFVPEGEGSCLEIGCFPGTYLAVFGELGYQLNGIDRAPGVETTLPSWLELKGYRVGEFEKADFSDFAPRRKFDVVSSFGFIEHFHDWARVLKRQASFVKTGGLLVVTVPNFRGVVQRALHLLLDGQNYRRHNIASMNPDLWTAAIVDMDFEVVYSGYFGSFGFWNEEQRRGRIRNEALYYVYRLMPALQKMLPEDKAAYSPFCGLIARKR